MLDELLFGSFPRLGCINIDFCEENILVQNLIFFPLWIPNIQPRTTKLAIAVSKTHLFVSGELNIY